MSYTVIWRPSAEQQLADIWNDARDRRAVTGAADAIDSLLRFRPLDVGESRANDVRILIVSPLSVYYDVLSHDALVVVWSVWRYRER